MEGFGSTAMARGLEDALRKAEGWTLEMVPTILFAMRIFYRTLPLSLIK